MVMRLLYVYYVLCFVLWRSTSAQAMRCTLINAALSRRSVLRNRVQVSKHGLDSIQVTLHILVGNAISVVLVRIYHSFQLPNFTRHRSGASSALESLRIINQHPLRITALFYVPTLDLANSLG